MAHLNLNISTSTICHEILDDFSNNFWALDPYRAHVVWCLLSKNSLERFVSVAKSDQRFNLCILSRHEPAFALSNKDIFKINFAIPFYFGFKHSDWLKHFISQSER